jgi:cystathionine beta-lyase family protein involved in aluminum resistance
MTEEESLNSIFQEALDLVQKKAAHYDKIALINTQKVLHAFREEKVADYYLKPTTGYAYGDVGRESLDKIYSRIFHTEAALVRSQFVSGTHALAVAMLGNLKAGDEVVGLTGTPYDTMATVIGYPKVTPGSLQDIGVKYTNIPLKGSALALDEISKAVTSKTKMVHIQRSCGYSEVRNTLSVKEIGELIACAKKANPKVICFVDNCYGEFVEELEPTDVGADLMAGSLIKNLGGGIAPTGGYIVGREDLVYNAACRLTIPALAGEMGATLGDTAREFYQGLFLAPHIVMQAVKTVTFAAAVFGKLGYQVKPAAEQTRSDIIQCITLTKEEYLNLFCKAVQMFSPVDSNVVPVKGSLPGYQDPVIMAAGTFVQGASIELSADGPVRPPYNVFLQGGLTFEHGILAIEAAAKLIGHFKK